MKKRIILMLTTLCMIIAIAMPAGATNVLEESKELAMQSIVSEMIAQYPLEDRIADVKSKSLDEDVPEEIREAVTFSFSSSDEYSSTNINSLTKQGTSDIDYSVKNLGEVTVNGKSIGNLYSATGTKKTKSGSDTMLGVEAYLSIVWIDNLGMDNVLSLSRPAAAAPSTSSLINLPVSTASDFSSRWRSVGAQFQFPLGISCCWKNPTGWTGH